MKHKIILSIALFIGAVSACRTQHIAGENIPIPEGNRVVLAGEEYFRARYDLWVPAKNDIREALDVIWLFLKHAQADKTLSSYFRAEVKKILKNLSHYRVQFVGIILNNRRYIHCNFFHENSRADGWKQRLVMVAAGGFWYAYYDMELKKVVKIYINGCT
jgi:hypothetical protein